MYKRILLQAGNDEDDDIVELDIIYNPECKKSCLSKGYDW